MYIIHYAFLWIDEYIYIHLRIKIPLRANLTFLSLCCQKPILIIFLVLLRNGEWKKRKRWSKKRDTMSIIFKFHFLRNLSPEVKKINASLQNGIFRACKLIYPLQNLMFDMHFMLSTWPAVSRVIFHCICWITSSIAPQCFTWKIRY